MLRKHALKLTALFGLLVAMSLAIPNYAFADDDDPPSRVARLAYVQGSVSFQPGGTDDWVNSVLNRPVTTGDKLWSDNDGRAELQLDGSIIQLGRNTGFSFLNLGDTVTQVRLTEGTLDIHVRRMDRDEAYEVDTPNLAFSIYKAGHYRLTVNEGGDTTAIRIRDGEGEVTGGGTSYTVRPNDYATFSGTDQLDAYVGDNNNDEDDFDRWSSTRERRYEHSRSSRYVSEDVVGYEDLDDHGSWRESSEYGAVWYPRTTVADWAPYHYGHWAYIEPWGYTWVDNEPWGFAPFHYGRWANIEGRWGWIPSRPRVEGVEYVRPVYAPALVAFVGGSNFSIGVSVGGGGGGYREGGAVGWFPLGPREVYVPSYRTSPRYVQNVNVSNTNVNSTVVNNYYNTTVVNNNNNTHTNVSNVTYVNQRVPGGVSATTPQAFTSAQPVASNAVRVDQAKMSSAPVQVVQPRIVPTKQAVLGTNVATAQSAAIKRPPEAVQQRAVVAKAPPPPPPPAFEKRQEAIKSNGGQPLSVSQIRQIQPTQTAQPQAAVKVAPPPAKPAVPVQQAAKPGQPPARPGQQPGQPAQPGQPGQQSGQQGNAGNRQGSQNTAPQANPQANPQPNNGQQNRPGQPQPNQPVPPNANQPQNQNQNRPVTQPQPNQPAKPPNANQPGNRPGDRPQDRPATQPQPNQPANRPGDRPQDRTEPRPNPNAPSNRPADRPQDRPVTQPQPNQPANRPADRPQDRPAAQPQNRPAERPADRPAERPAPQSQNRPAERPAATPPPQNRPADRPAPTPQQQQQQKQQQDKQKEKDKDKEKPPKG